MSLRINHTLLDLICVLLCFEFSTRNISEVVTEIVKIILLIMMKTKWKWDFPNRKYYMMMSWHENVFHIIGPLQRASNVEYILMSWHHHAMCFLLVKSLMGFPHKGQLYWAFMFLCC